MSDINEVRSRLNRALDLGRAPGMAADIDALLADHARLQKAMSVPTDFDQQDWAGQSGSVAWHLIDRHANNWGEVGEMMEQWCAANSPSAGGAAMSAPIIPADQWPEGADRHCWDANGLGFFHVPTTEGAQMWLLVLKQSHIPLPAGWDWRVPVMRQQATAIDLEQFREAVESLRLGATRAEHHEECDRLLALIDGQARDNGVRVDRGALQMAINALRRAGKHEVADALAGGVIDGQSVSEKPQKRRCPNNAVPGGCQLPNRFCTFPDCEKADKLLPTKGEGIRP